MSFLRVRRILQAYMQECNFVFRSHSHLCARVCSTCAALCWSIFYTFKPLGYDITRIDEAETESRPWWHRLCMHCF